MQLVRAQVGEYNLREACQREENLTQSYKRIKNQEVRGARAVASHY